ncbi:MAG: hypothetical protein ACKOW9_03400 [Candidatus Paceibacterota bacterium]
MNLRVPTTDNKKVQKIAKYVVIGKLSTNNLLGASSRVLITSAEINWSILKNNTEADDSNAVITRSVLK